MARPYQHDLAVFVRHPEDQHLGHDRTDLAGWKIDNGQHLPPDQPIRRVMPRQLCR